LNLEINNVSKLYRGDVWGLRGFSLDIGSGILGLLGPNGAGKSTLMQILATLTKPSGGTIRWNRGDIVKGPETIRKILGYLPQDFGIYPNLNAVEFLSYLAAARGIDGRSGRRRIEQLLDMVNIGEARKRRLGTFSGGMKQRVGIAQALLNDPELLIVDEPTAGLDPEERVRFRNLLTELAGERIVILSSHIVSDIEAAAMTVAIINKGHLIRHAAPEELLRLVEGKIWEVVVPSTELPGLRQKYTVGSTFRTVDGIKARVITDKIPNEKTLPLAPTLEDAYLYLLTQDRIRSES
jgi:ABC-2 type transport system ATP-binding protein